MTIHNLTSKGKAPLLIQVGHNAGNKRKRPGAQSSGAGAGADSNDSASEEHEDTGSCDSDSSASDSGTEAGAGVDVNGPVYQGLYIPRPLTPGLSSMYVEYVCVYISVYH